MESIENAVSYREIVRARHRAVRCLRQNERRNETNDLRNSGSSNDEIIAQLDTARDRAIVELEASAGDKSVMNNAQEIFPRLYLGPFSVATDMARLQKIGITHIICLSAEGPDKPHSNNAIQYLCHPLVETHCTLEDGAKQLVETIQSAFVFTNRALATNDSTKVLIHCLHGKTRSAAVASCIVALLSRDTNLSFQRAYEHVKSYRDVIVPEEWHHELQEAIDSTRLVGHNEKDTPATG